MKLFTLGLCVLSTWAFAQTTDYIFKFKESARNSRSAQMMMSRVGKMEVISEELGLYKISLPKIATRNQVKPLFNNSNVEYFQEDHKVTRREAIPNDAEFSKQWSMKNPNGVSDIKATYAWLFGVGGKMSDGHEVVVAVIDGGVDVTHQDLKENIWTNKFEIPNNGIDDDGNGYVDDVYGWNSDSDNGMVEPEAHGTHVAGIVSAHGNNGAGVVGVNWNAKVMSISANLGSTSSVLKAYAYALKQKQIWLETNGERGANVVVTNSSFGVDGADCTTGEYPAWNDMYDLMGRYGILSAAATANRAWDIDKKGDVPTSCASEFIISVTNTTQTDGLNSGAGWGLNTIDLGAPGAAIYSTVPGDRYQNMTGTSMATPHVAGAVAYLHSVASPYLTYLIRQNPAYGASLIKYLMMISVDPVESLQGKTVSGGRLNLYRAAEYSYYFNF